MFGNATYCTCEFTQNQLRTCGTFRLFYLNWITVANQFEMLHSILFALGFLSGAKMLAENIDSGLYLLRAHTLLTKSLADCVKLGSLCHSQQTSLHKA